MTVMPTARDYSLIGRDGRLAVENGLAAAEWYHTDIPRKEMKELMKREDGPAIRDTILWLALFVVFGGLAIALWPSWWAVIPLFATARSTARPTDSRWHECGHGTAFKTRWMNDAVYQFACFMIMREPEIWRWSTPATTPTPSSSAATRRSRRCARRRSGASSSNVFAITNVPTRDQGASCCTPPAGSARRRRPSCPRGVAEGLSAPPASGSRSTSVPIALALALGSWLPVLLVGAAADDVRRLVLDPGRA